MLGVHHASQSPHAESVAQAAIWAAQGLHVLDRHPEQGAGDDHSGAIGINAQETLLNATTPALLLR